MVGGWLVVGWLWVSFFFNSSLLIFGIDVHHAWMCLLFLPAIVLASKEHEIQHYCGCNDSDGGVQFDAF